MNTSFTCVAGGICSRIDGTCICTEGFSGPTCEDDGQNLCIHSPCENGGECIDLIKDYKCRCKPGFVGVHCQINIDECEMQPCANGGHCTDLVNGFRCECQPGWAGTDCSENINECLPMPCQHGGVCHDKINDYQCQCPEPFFGKNCQNYPGMSTTEASTPMPPAVTKSPTPSPKNPPNSFGNISQQVDSQSDELTPDQLLLVVCLGAGLPILLIIIVVVILLCRRRRMFNNNQNMNQENHDNYINNMNNRSNKNIEREPKRIDDDDDDNDSDCRRGHYGGHGGHSACSSSKDTYERGDSGGGGGGGGMIFTTTYPLQQSQHMHKAASTVAHVQKISNEEQQDINRLNTQAARDKAARKNFLRDSLGAAAGGSKAGGSRGECVSPSPCSSFSLPTPSLPSHRDSRVYDIDKPLPRRLDVDSLQEDTKIDIR